MRADPQAAAATGTARAVRIIDLLDDEVDLRPARHLTPVTEGQAERFGPTRDRLAEAVSVLSGLVPELTVPATARDLPMTTVGELVRAGAISVEQAPLRMSTDAGELPVLTSGTCVPAARRPVVPTRSRGWPRWCPGMCSSR